MKTYQIGIIGCGAIASLHRDALLACPGVRIAAVCDILPERAEAMAESISAATPDNGRVRVYEDWRRMLAEADLDCVHLCTPHFLHPPMAIAAMRAGLHVLTEKPMGIAVTDAEEMARVASETGKRLGVCFQNRYNATSVRMRELIDSGRVGRVLGGRAIVTWKRDAEYYGSGPWRGTWDEEGGGVMINQAIHTLDLLQWLMGTPVSIRGSIDTRLLAGVIEVEDTAEALIRFKDGINGLFYATNNYCADAPVLLEIVCEGAVMRLDGDLTIRYADGLVETVAEKDVSTGEKAYWGCGHKVLVADWYDRMRARRAFPIDGKAGLPALRMVLGLYESARSGREIALD